MPREPQPNEPFEEPPFEQIAGISRMHAQAMESMDDDIVWKGAGMHQVIIYTIGRKSGNEHKVVVPVWFDDDGHRIVVASYAGAAKHPHWYLNLADRTRQPGGAGPGAGPRVLGRRAHPRGRRLRRRSGMRSSRTARTTATTRPGPHAASRSCAWSSSDRPERGGASMDIGDSPEEAAFRAEARAFLEAARRAEAGRGHERRRAEPTRPRLDVGPHRTVPRVAARALRQRLGRHHLAEGVRRPGRHRPCEQAIFNRGESRSSTSSTGVFTVGIGDGRADDHRARQPTSSRSATSTRCCAATRSGASCSASRAPAPTSPLSAPAPCATATSGSSTARRCGTRTRNTPTAASCSPAPIPTRPSTAASPTSSST